MTALATSLRSSRLRRISNRNCRDPTTKKSAPTSATKLSTSTFANVYSNVLAVARQVSPKMTSISTLCVSSNWEIISLVFILASNCTRWKCLHGHMAAPAASRCARVTLHSAVEVLDDVRRAQRPLQRPVRRKRSTVSVSSSPSRKDTAAPGWSPSSERARRSRARLALVPECRSHAVRSAVGRPRPPEPAPSDVAHPDSYPGTRQRRAGHAAALCPAEGAGVLTARFPP